MSEWFKVAAAYVALVAAFAASYSLNYVYLSYEATRVLAYALGIFPALLLLRYGLVNFGVALYYGAGAYVAAMLYRLYGVRDLALLLAASAATSGALGLTVGALTARFRGVYYALFNLALSVAFYGLVLKLYYVTGGSDGAPMPSAGIPVLFAVLAAASAAASAFGYLFDKSPLGRIAEGVRLRELRVVALGVKPERHIAFVTAISAAFAGLGGAAQGFMDLRVFPEYFYWTTSTLFVVGAIAGLNLSTSLGFLAGGLAIVAILVAANFTTYPELLMGALLMALMALLTRLWRS